MSTNRSVKYVALMLAVISTLLMFMPWVAVRNVDKETMISIRQNIDKTVDSTVDEIVEEAEGLGIHVSTKGVKAMKKAIMTLRDLKVSAVEMDSFSSGFGPVFGKMAKLYKELSESSQSYYYHSSGWYSDPYEDYLAFKVFSVYMTIYRTVYVLTLTAFVLFVVSCLTDRIRIPRWPLFVTRLLVLLWMFAGVLLIRWGLDENGGMGTVRLALTGWGILSVILAVPEKLYARPVAKLLGDSGETALSTAGEKVGGLFGRLPAGAVREKMAAAALAVGGRMKKSSSDTWECPECHEKNKGTSKFCFSCGKPNPNIVICPVCGKILKKDDRFCSDCGNKIG